MGTIEPRAERRTRYSLAIYVAAVLAVLGLPLWLFTTSIIRAELPIKDIERLNEQLNDEITFKIPIYMDLPNSQRVFVDACQNLLTKELEQRYPGITNIWRLDLHRILDRNVSVVDDYVLRIKNDDEDAQLELYYISPYSKEITLTVTKNAISSNNVAHFVVETLLDKVFKLELEAFYQIHRFGKKNPIHENHVVLPYSPHYNLVFSLFTQDGTPISWGIESLIKTLYPLLQKLQHFANFTISTQIQYYSEPSNPMRYDNSSDAFVIKESELSTFINHGDWNLFGHDINPTVNFLVYFPKSNYDNKKTLIERSTTNSFLINQWGGVYVFNKDMPIIKNVPAKITEDELLPIMEIFSSQLFELLGVPHEPISPSIRIDSLTRLATYENLRQLIDNLQSLIKVSEALADILIPDETQFHAVETITNIKEALQILQQNITSCKQFEGITVLSAQAVTASNKAFFDKEMVQQAYFPSEHKLAVFLPLLGPVGSIVTFGLIATLKLMKRDRDDEKRKRAEEKAKKSE